MYKKFSDLTEQEQQQIKIRSVNSLQDYIKLKRQLGIKNDEMLFEDDAT